MEYLMTYGWAILIIAIVLGVLYYLGVFSSANLAPRAQPGSCQVFRPNGPGTSYDVGLSGTCNNELPEYVAQFNGATSLVSTGTSGLPLGGNPRSVFAWIYLNSVDGAGCSPYIYGYGSQVSLEWSDLRVCDGVLSFSGYGDDVNSPYTPTLNAWNFVGYTYQGTSITFYYNGQSNTLPLTALNTVLPGSFPSVIGIASGGGGINLHGSVADVQLYNATLSSNEVQALYLEGIGGAPIKPTNLVGWWPLNGNPNDYSGNLNQGTATAVAYTSSWTSGYTAP